MDSDTRPIRSHLPRWRHATPATVVTLPGRLRVASGRRNVRRAGRSDLDHLVDDRSGTTHRHGFPNRWLLRRRLRRAIDHMVLASRPENHLCRWASRSRTVRRRSSTIGPRSSSAPSTVAPDIVVGSGTRRWPPSHPVWRRGVRMHRREQPDADPRGRVRRRQLDLRHVVAAREGFGARRPRLALDFMLTLPEGCRPNVGDLAGILSFAGSRRRIDHEASDTTLVATRFKSAGLPLASGRVADFVKQANQIPVIRRGSPPPACLFILVAKSQTPPPMDESPRSEGPRTSLVCPSRRIRLRSWSGR